MRTLIGLAVICAASFAHAEKAPSHNFLVGGFVEVEKVDAEVEVLGKPKPADGSVLLHPAHRFSGSRSVLGDYAYLKQTPTEFGDVIQGGFNCTGGELTLEKNKKYFIIVRKENATYGPPGCIVDVKDTSEVIGKNWTFSKYEATYEPGPYKAVPAYGLLRTSTEAITMQPGVMDILTGKKSINEPADQTSSGLSLEETLKNALPGSAGNR